MSQQITKLPNFVHEKIKVKSYRDPLKYQDQYSQEVPDISIRTQDRNPEGWFLVVFGISLATLVFTLMK